MTTDRITALARRLSDAKRAEAEAREAREAVEIEIYNEIAKSQTIPERGVVAAGAIKMTTKVNESWDQDILSELAKVIPPALFPFKTEWKCDGRARNKLAVDHPEVYRKLTRALTTKTAKPSFVVDEEALA